MLFESFDLGGIRLANRTVRSPMTRNRCSQNSAPDDRTRHEHFLYPR